MIHDNGTVLSFNVNSGWISPLHGKLAGKIKGHSLEYCLVYLLTVAHPGFHVGGTWTHYGSVWTSDAGAFHRKCMQKQTNWVPLGACARQAP